MKFRRSERLVDMTNYLLEHPGALVSLTLFSERYESAKSSISEDLAIIKETFEQRGIGTLTTVPGAAGGVKYIVRVRKRMQPLLLISYARLFLVQRDCCRVDTSI